MDLGIQGKVAVVTGSSKGIGYAVAKGLAAEGVRVMLSARNERQLMRAVEELRLHGAEAAGYPADVSHEADIADLLLHTEERFGTPDIVLINAGGPPTGQAATLTDEAWLQGYQLTLMSAVRLARAVIPDMRSKGWGRIINITSLSIKQPVANLTLSNAFRSAVTGFAKTLSTEVAASGITVNNVGPGYTATERLEELFTDPDARDRLIHKIPAQRFGTADEVASAAVYLASVQAAYITGQTLIVDGGVVAATY